MFSYTIFVVPHPSLSSHMVMVFKLEKIIKGSLDSTPLPSPSMKIQIMGGKVCLRCKGKTLRDVVNKLFDIKSSSNVLQSKLSHPWFEFSLKVKVMGSNSGHLLKYFYFTKMVKYVLKCQKYLALLPPIMAISQSLIWTEQW